MADTALVMLSGGLDSTVALFWAWERYDDVRAVCFDYGQMHSVEIDSALKIGKITGTPVDVVDLKGAMRGPLIDGKGSIDPETGLLGVKEACLVHARNMVFLSIMAQRAKIGHFHAIVVGFDSDVSGGNPYPDTKFEFVKASEACLRLGADMEDLRVIAPLIGLTKSEIIRESLIIEGCYDALAYTHTCFKGSQPPCGVCQTCMTREAGFATLGVKDPLIKRLSSYKKRVKGAKTATQGRTPLFVIDGSTPDS